MSELSELTERLAREAGIRIEPRWGLVSTGNKQLERFTQLVAMECAKVCASQRDVYVRNRRGYSDWETGCYDGANECSDAIRERFGIEGE